MRTATLSVRVAVAICALCVLAFGCAADDQPLRPGAATVATPAPVPTATTQPPPTALALPADAEPPTEYVLYNETAGFRGNEPGNELVLASFDSAGDMTVWHSWPNTLAAPEGSPAYLTSQGNLLIAGATPNVAAVDNIPVGSWSTLQLLGGDGTVLWEYSNCDPSQCLHHDVEPLPNGNVLAFVYYRVAADKAAEFGIDSVDGVWMDKVVELRPQFGEQAAQACDGTAWCTDIVWEWDPANHAVVPDADDDRGTSTAQSIDLRTSDGGVDGADPIHFNGIDYNATLDQIAISSFSLSEIFIVDHGGTDEIMYRWGRASNYGQPGFDVLGHQHDPHWVDDTRLSVMNNNSPFGEFLFDTPSEVLLLDLPVNNEGRYNLVDGHYGPDQPVVVVDRQREPRLNAPFMSGATVRPDGSSLVSLSLSKELASFDASGATEWLVRLPGPGGQFWKAQVLADDDQRLRALVEQTGPLTPRPHQCAVTPSSTYCMPRSVETEANSEANAADEPTNIAGSDRTAPLADVAGVWVAAVDGQNGTLEQPLELIQDGDQLSGFLGPHPIVGGVEGNVVEFSSTLETPFGALPASFELVVDGQTMSGLATLDGLPIELAPQEVVVSR